MTKEIESLTRKRLACRMLLSCYEIYSYDECHLLWIDPTQAYEHKFTIIIICTRGFIHIFLPSFHCDHNYKRHKKVCILGVCWYKLLATPPKAAWRDECAD